MKLGLCNATSGGAAGEGGNSQSVIFDTSGEKKKKVRFYGMQENCRNQLV